MPTENRSQLLLHDAISPPRFRNKHASITGRFCFLDRSYLYFFVVEKATLTSVDIQYNTPKWGKRIRNDWSIMNVATTPIHVTLRQVLIFCSLDHLSCVLWTAGSFCNYLYLYLENEQSLTLFSPLEQWHIKIHCLKPAPHMRVISQHETRTCGWERVSCYGGTKNKSVIQYVSNKICIVIARVEIETKFPANYVYTFRGYRSFMELLLCSMNK